MSSESLNKTVCSYMWNSLCIRYDNRLVPCCWFDDKVEGAHFDNLNTSIEEAFNSSFYKTLRRDALDGKPNKGCESCYFKEREVGHSLRIRANNYWETAYNSEQSSLDRVTYVELFVGNHCNLKCLMCSPKLSSSLATDYVNLGIQDEAKKVPFENDYRELVSRLPNLNRIKFVGGEPIMNQSHWDLLDSIPEEKAKKIKLEYATNCTVFPNEKMLALWDKFYEMEIFLSIDGYNKVNEYIRFPSQWDRVEKNAKRFQEFIKRKPGSILGINSVVSIYNIYDLDHLTQWVEDSLEPLVDNYGNTTFFLASLNYPEYLSIKNLPQTLKDELLQKYPDGEHYSYAKAFLREKGDVQLLKELKNKTHMFDNLRKISCVEYIPAMAKVLDF